MTATENRDSLKFQLLGSKEELGSWGHEYVRYNFHNNSVMNALFVWFLLLFFGGSFMILT